MKLTQIKCSVCPMLDELEERLAEALFVAWGDEEIGERACGVVREFFDIVRDELATDAVRAGMGIKEEAAG